MSSSKTAFAEIVISRSPRRRFSPLRLIHVKRSWLPTYSAQDQVIYSQRLINFEEIDRINEKYQDEGIFREVKAEIRENTDI